MKKNKLVTSLIGKGFNNTITPSVIRRNVLENPNWYTAYSPYQAEISQGRLESLYNFQTMVSELTQIPLANASMLDIGSTTAEVVSISNAFHKNNRNTFFASETLHPYMLDILETKCDVMDINLKIGKSSSFSIDDDTIGVMFQYPDTYGTIDIPIDLINDAKENNSIVSAATDLLALTKFVSPGEINADIAFGTAQRFGIPMYYGGPHPAFLALDHKLLRFLPGRIVGVGIDSNNTKCYRLALQSREQHIKKDKAISNICTSQALLANMAAFYAIHHGTSGLKNIAEHISSKAYQLYTNLLVYGLDIVEGTIFDTITINSKDARSIYKALESNGYIAFFDENHPDQLSISIDETTTKEDISNILIIFQEYSRRLNKSISSPNENPDYIRKSPVLSSEIFNNEWTETELMRYMYSLSSKDYTLCQGMIPLGSCTMKLNAAYQLEPLSWPEVSNIHPYLPKEYVMGYRELIEEVGTNLKHVTGLNHVSFQSNSGAMGEYTALLCIKKFHNNERNICMIPSSAHGTNFASASLANMKIVKFDDTLFDDIDEFSKFVEKYKDNLGVMMVTYPNTNGIFQKNIRIICDIIHNYGGLVYLDGANMNAMAGNIIPADLGVDVCHLNLHKTFCIPHGGGGPGMGPILCNDKLSKFLPVHRYQCGSEENPYSIGTITASQWSSASLLTIPYLYFKELGYDGIREATNKAISNANYMKNALAPYYNVSKQDVAHEFIIDISDLSGVTEVDISKRLIDYSFHPPTMSWPKKGTLMIEPTESESKEEMDRFITAMINIRKEIDENVDVLKNAPHPITLTSKEWKYSYSQQKAFFPVPSLLERKTWPTISRVDDVYGDKQMYKINFPVP